MILEVCISVGKGLASNFLSINKSLEIIDHVYTILYEVCYEIKESKLDVVKSSLANISISEDAKIIGDELNKAISFLESAYFFSLKLINKIYKKKVSFLIVFSYIEETMAVPYESRKVWYEGLIDTAAILYLLYKYKNCLRIAHKWLNITLSLWNDYVDSYQQLAPQELLEINGDFAYVTRSVEIVRMEISEIVTKYEEVINEEWHITDCGDEFVKNRNRELKDQFKMGLEKMEIVL